VAVAAWAGWVSDPLCNRMKKGRGANRAHLVFSSPFASANGAQRSRAPMCTVELRTFCATPP
jgi:hypothetical protein